VKVTSLGFRTDLMLRRLSGSIITDCGRHLVVRTPANPGFWWGNFVLFPFPPAPGEAPKWRAVFAAEFPDARHLAFGVDGVSGEVGDESELAALGLTAEVSTVLTGRDLHTPARPNNEATFRCLDDDDEDWAQAVQLRSACADRPRTPDEELFDKRKLTEARELYDRGHGAWFGAFVDGRMRAGLGVFSDGSGLARFQSVETHPDFRRRGLASHLVHAAGRYGISQLHAHTLVIVADPHDTAVRIYRSLGFTDAERQVQLQREPQST
jgi:ribosomal protein S18 acetylase RimI-like enzyme